MNESTFICTALNHSQVYLKALYNDACGNKPIEDPDLRGPGSAYDQLGLSFPITDKYILYGEQKKKHTMVYLNLFTFYNSIYSYTKCISRHAYN